MTVEQRRRAASRLAAFEAWRLGEKSIDEAVESSGLSRSRFYRLAADWRAAPSIDALGAFVGSGASRPRLDPDAVNALQAVVADVVATNDGATVAQLVRLMVQAAGVEEARLPNPLRLRQFVEDEQRRISASGDAGDIVVFDCTAINLPRADGRPHVMFAVADRGTRLVMGTAVASSADVEVGYRLASQDALAWIGSLSTSLPWALRTSQMLMVAGADPDRATDLRRRLIEGGVRSNVILARVPKRYGRYLKDVFGPRIGRIAITPGRTEAGSASPDNGDMSPWSEAEAAAAVRAVADEHNAALMKDLRPSDARVPDDLQLALRLLASL